MAICPKFDVAAWEMTQAQRRVAAFLDARAKMRGIDHDEIHSLNVGPGGEGQYLYTADLRLLLEASSRQDEQ